MAGLQFIVPPGIGDVGWIYSKVEALAARRRIAFLPCNDPPRRSLPYLQLLPRIHAPGYAGVSWFSSQRHPLSTDTDLEKLPDGVYHVNLNRHLERGRRIELAFPSQPTNLHYLMSLPAAGALENQLGGVSGLRLCVYCSSNRHGGGRQLWEVAEWVRFLEGVKEEVGPCTFILVGAPYDSRTVEVGCKLRDRGHAAMLFIGQPIGHTLNLIQLTHYFFSFPSGLGTVADVLNFPCMMWYWANKPRLTHQQGIFTSWADQCNMDSGQMLIAPYDSVEASLKLWKERGRKHVRMAR